MPEPTPLAEKIAALNALRDAPTGEAVTAALRGGLADRSPHVVAKAAELAGELELGELVADLLRAYQRAFVNPLKKDPGCVAKTALATTLTKLDYQDLDTYRRGIKYEQYEPVWGGEKDTAAQLRAVCAAGMVSCATAMEALTCFADLLADACRPARIGAARAIAGLGHWEGVPLLRLKLQVGDQEPDVIGECCTALLELEPDGSLELVLQLLSSRDTDVRVQAALALGESRHPQALSALCECFRTERELSLRGILLTCIGLLRSPQSREFLVSLVKQDNSTTAADAIRALAPYSMIEELRDQVAQAVATSGSDQLQSVFEDEFGER